LAIKPRKKFDAAHYMKNQKCFDSLQNHFRFLYPHLREEDYSIDVAVYLDKAAYKDKHEPLCYLELEGKEHWKGDKFPEGFADVQFLAKKQKYALLDKPVYWVLFNASCSNAAIIDLNRITRTCDLNVVECKGKEYEFDFFYRVPKDTMIWGIEHLERFLIYDAFRAKEKIHNLLKE
jgi:hypothetical protein